MSDQPSLVDLAREFTALHTRFVHGRATGPEVLAWVITHAYEIIDALESKPKHDEAMAIAAVVKEPAVEEIRQMHKAYVEVGRGTMASTLRCIIDLAKKRGAVMLRKPMGR